MEATDTATAEPRSASHRSQAGGPPRSRQTRSERTRRKLLEAGRSLFAEHGPSGVTSHAIAARAGYASGTFYLHFKDKFVLFRELAEEAAGALEARLMALRDDANDPYRTMRNQAEALVGFAEEQRELMLILFHPGSEVAEIGEGILEKLAAGISERRREAVRAGLAQDCFEADVLAQAIVGMWARVLTWWAEDPTRADREALARTLTHFQLHGNRAEAGFACRWPEGDSTK